MIEPRRAHVEHALRVLAELDRAAAIRLGGDEVKMRHLRNAVSDSLVERPLCRLATVEVRDGNPGDERGLCRSEDLEPVAEQHDDVGVEPGEGVGEPDHAESDRLGNADGRVTRQQHFDPLVNLEPIRFDGPDRHPKLGREVHPGDGELEFERVVGLDLTEEPVQQPVLGARAGDNTDLTLRHGWVRVRRCWGC